MKLFKKFLAVFLTLVLVLSLCACGNAGSDTQKEEDTQNSTEEPTSESTTEESSTEEPTENTTEEPTEDDSAVSFGTVSGNTYENTFIGLSCTLDDSWYILSREEVAALSGITSELITDEDLKQLMSTVGAVTDFYAMKDDGLTTVNITITDLGISVGSSSEQAVVEAMLPTLENAYVSMGYSNLELTTETAEFAGSSHPCIVVSAEFNGAQIFQRQVFLLVDHYSVTVTSTTYQEDGTTDVFDAFAPLA